MKDIKDKSVENQKYQAELLSLMLNNDEVYIKSIDVIRSDMFTGINRIIFDTYVKMVTDCTHPDPVSISTLSNIPVNEVLDIYTQYSGVNLDVKSILYELYDFMAKDKLIKMGANIHQQVMAGTQYEDILDIVNNTMRSLELGNSSSVITMQDGLTRLLEIITNNRKQLGTTGIPTGLEIFDKHMGGLQSNYIILAGEISHGKTALALSMLFNSATAHQVKCGIISLEMTSEELTARLAAMATGISGKHLLTGKLSDEQVELFNSKINKLLKSNLFIQDYIKQDISDVIAAVRLMRMQHGIEYIVIENAGNISVKGVKDPEQRTADISRKLKALNLELKIPVILISHLSRLPHNERKQPDLTRLRHSGQLEQDADIVVFVYRPELHGFDTFQGNDESFINSHGRAKVYFAKGRNCGLAKSYPEFFEEITYFSDYRETASAQYGDPKF